MWYYFYGDNMENVVRIYLFYGDTCPVCEKERAYLEEVKKEYSNIEIIEYEVYRIRENREHLENLKEMYSISQDGVPFTVIGDTAILGFGGASKARFEYLIKKYSKESYDDRVGNYLGLDEIETETIISSEISTSIIEPEVENDTSSFEIGIDIIIPFVILILIGCYFILGAKKNKIQTKI